jgi:hypothetical protein
VSPSTVDSPRGDANKGEDVMEGLQLPHPPVSISSYSPADGAILPEMFTAYVDTVVQTIERL